MLYNTVVSNFSAPSEIPGFHSETILFETPLRPTPAHGEPQEEFLLKLWEEFSSSVREWIPEPSEEKRVIVWIYPEGGEERGYGMPEKSIALDSMFMPPPGMVEFLREHGVEEFPKGLRWFDKGRDLW